MRTWHRLIALIVLSICLPVQAWAVVVQPFCELQAKHAAAGSEHALHGANANEDAPPPQHDQVSNKHAPRSPSHSGHDGSAPTSHDQAPAHDCGQCAVCHLALSSPLPGGALAVADLPPVVHPSTVIPDRVDFLTEPLLHPPQI